MKNSAHSSPAAELKDIVESGIAVEILDADRAWFLLDAVRNYAVPKSAKQFVDAVTELAAIHLTLAAVKLYEKPKEYPLRSIPRALDLISEASGDLEICHRPAVEARLRRTTALAHGLADADLSVHIVARFREMMPNCEYEGTNLEACRTLDHLKVWRDKRMAHSEAVHPSILPAIGMDAVWALLAYAKEFVSIVGLAFTATAYDSDDGHYFLSDDARRGALAYKKMMKGIAEQAGAG